MPSRIKTCVLSVPEHEELIHLLERCIPWNDYWNFPDKKKGGNSGTGTQRTPIRQEQKASSPWGIIVKTFTVKQKEETWMCKWRTSNLSSEIPQARREWKAITGSKRKKLQTQNIIPSQTFIFTGKCNKAVPKQTEFNGICFHPNNPTNDA